MILMTTTMNYDRDKSDDRDDHDDDQAMTMRVRRMATMTIHITLISNTSKNLATNIKYSIALGY